MKSNDRMFRVVVLGGIALTACGGAVTTSSDAGSDGFPAEGPAPYDASLIDTAQQFDGFPTEGPDTYTIDAGEDAGVDAGCFPRETAIVWDGCAPPPDSGSGDESIPEGGTTESGATDGGSAYDGFPQEGPARIDF
jgi:hypothetical protein